MTDKVLYKYTNGDFDKSTVNQKINLYPETEVILVKTNQCLLYSERIQGSQHATTWLDDPFAEDWNIGSQCNSLLLTGWS